MQRKRKIFALSAVTVLSLAATACGSNNPVESPTPSASSASTSTSSSTSTSKPDPLAKYDPPIEVTSARLVDSNFKFREGDSIDNNPWTKGYEKELGIKLKNIWTVTGTQPQYDQKLNLSIASGDLPDTFQVNAVQLKQLVEANQLEDLTKSYADYISPLAKQYYEADGGTALKSATFGGKLLAIPQLRSLPDGAPILFVRMDWLKKLNLPEPKTMDDVFKIAEAFATKDPDGNGKNDTYGLPITKDFDYFEGIANAFHAYTQKMWIKDSTGKLAPGHIQPEMKNALARMQQMYKSGQMDPEFGVKDFGKVSQDIAAGKFGIFFSGPAAPIVPLQSGKDKDPNMDWKSFPIPSIDGKPANGQLLSNISNYVVVKKGVKNPEALIKLINFTTEKIDGKTADLKTYSKGDDGIEIFKYRYAFAADVYKNVNAYRHIKEALEKNDPSKLKPDEKLSYDRILLFRGGDSKWWNMERVFGPTGSFGITDYYDNNKLFMKTEFYGAATPTMAEKQSSLDKLQQETFTKIIMGTSSIDEFNTFVDNWKKLGGEAIIKEVNDWKMKQ
ncbi:extracellular solute-binding protein [Paenibacillus sedimenti]|uniref:Extracellular solute-binding protein n=1 Tax=Paenibacillus sedimenti TaxID=2770274 RepID=A0A926QIV2_9BACL|nr:extracellular solute-binding protein [Paenibacillus sedimenti]MBD0380905.1 extracellular solute-binding protein [Paenibacillus sedimenti]